MFIPFSWRTQLNKLQVYIYWYILLCITDGSPDKTSQDPENALTNSVSVLASVSVKPELPEIKGKIKSDPPKFRSRYQTNNKM